MISPHGGRLVDRVLKGACREEALEKAGSLPVLEIDQESVSDVENIATGVYSPARGLHGALELPGRPPRDAASRRYRPGRSRSSSTPTAKRRPGSRRAPRCCSSARNRRPVAILHLEEKFELRQGEAAEKVFLTSDPAHPGVAKVAGHEGRPPGRAGRPDRGLADPFDRYKLTPEGNPHSVQGEGLADGGRRSRRETRPTSGTNTSRRPP